MVYPRTNARTFEIPECHGGTGVLRCTEYIGEYGRAAAGFTFVHDNILVPGASVGEHRHTGDEEVYIILDGNGAMLIDGVPREVAAGDIAITRSGHTHSLTNTGTLPIRFLVVGTSLGQP